MRTEYPFFLSVVYDLLNAVIFATKHCKRTYSLLKSCVLSLLLKTQQDSSQLPTHQAFLALKHNLVWQTIFFQTYFVESRAVTQRTKKDHQQRVRNISSKCICVHICIRMYVMLQKLHTAL